MGGLPSSIGRLYNLVFLDISGNNLRESLPQVLEGSTLPNVMYFRLTSNTITCKLPMCLGEVTKLIVLDLDFNLLEGNIPDSLGKLQNLTNLGLAGNRLNGTYQIVFTFFLSYLFLMFLSIS